MYRIAPCILAVAILLAAPVSADASDYRILYAERIDIALPQLQALPSGAGARKPNATSELAFDAYGAHYALRLQPNESLTRTLDASLIKGKSLYRGTIDGKADSWVRLTLVAGRVYGAMWDGSEFYSISPLKELARHMDAPAGVPLDATMVYRLSDTQGGVSEQFCGVEAAASERGAALRQYRSVIQELKQSPVIAQVSGPLQIEVALVGDVEFHALFPDAEGAMLARANIVDGIFSGQLGVTIVPTDFIVMTDTTNPLQSTAGPELLEQFGSYRNATPVVRARGLAHLMTGKEIDGSTAGIGYLGSLCDAQFGVSVSESAYDAGTSALIMAHELGHNFGAPHDGQSGSACASTPLGFLMSPQLNGSNVFSACSRAQMQPNIDAATCIVPLKVADVLVDAAAPVQAYTGEPFEVPFDVRAAGDLESKNVVVRVDLVFQPDSVEAAGGTCAINGPTATCQLGTLPVGDVRRIVVRGTSAFVRLAADIQIQVQSANDRNLSNNSTTAHVTVTSAADIEIITAPAVISGMVRAPISFSINLASTGVRTAQNVAARLYLESMQVLSATTTGGSCTPAQNILNCSFADIPSGTSRRIDVTASASLVQGQFGSVAVTASNDLNNANDTHPFPITIVPERDVKIELPPQGFEMLIGSSIQIPIILRSAGTLASAASTVTIFHDIALEFIVEAATVQGGTCSVNGSDVVCNIASIEAGGTRTLTLTVRGDAAGQYQAHIDVSSAGDDVDENDHRGFSSIAFPAVEVEVSTGGGDSAFPNTGVQYQNVSFITARGFGAVTNIAVAMTLPPQFRVNAATLSGGTCDVQGQLVSCVLASLARDAKARFAVDFTALQAGSYTSTVSIAAQGDTTPFNNSVVWNYTVKDAPDASIDPSASANAIVGVQSLIPVTVRTGNLVVDQVVVNIAAPAFVSLQGTEVLNGTCLQNGSSNWNCFLGTMQANTSKDILVKVRSSLLGSFNLVAGLSAAGDVNPANNTMTVPVTVSDRVGDAALQWSASAVTAEVGKTFSYPRFTIVANETVDDARITVALDPALMSFAGATAQGGACAPSSGGVECVFGTIERGATREVSLSLMADHEGSFSSAMTFSSRNDTNPANDTGQVSITLSKSAPPAPPPPPDKDSGGGGGGAFSPECLLALLSVWLLSRRRAGKAN